MYITITSLKLRRLRYFFALSYSGFKITLQTRRQNGFVKMKNTGFGYRHYTISAWESERDLKNFARSGAHREAMKSSRKISEEIRIYTFESEEFPGWNEAKKLIFENGRVLSFE